MPTIFDLETQNLISQTGSVETLQISVACSFNTRDQQYTFWWEPQAAEFLDELQRASLIVGYNVNAFDYKVLSFYGDIQDLEPKTFDLYDQIRHQTGHPPSLDRLAQINLGEAKTHSGIQAVQLWRASKLEELANKCQQDVELTWRLFDLWQATGILWVSDTNYVVWPGLAHLLDDEEEDDETT